MKNKDTVTFHNKTIHISEISNMNYNDQCDLLKIKGNAIQYLMNATLEQQLIAVRQNGYAIRHISNPTYEVQKQAFTTSPTAVQFVKNPIEELLMQAFDKDPNVLPFLKNPTYKQKLSAVSRKGATIQYISCPTPELIDVAINQNPMAIGHLNNADNKYILKAINANPKCVKNIINKLPRNLVIEALKRKGYLIKYINDPDNELIQIAIKSQPSAIQYIKRPTIEAQIIAIKESPKLIDCVDTKIEEVQIAAVESKPENIYKINEPTSNAITAYDDTVIKLKKSAKKELFSNNIPPSIHYQTIHKYQRYIAESLSVKGYCSFVNQYNEFILDIIKAIFLSLNIKSICIATGYLFKSGINLLNNIISPIISSGGKIDLVVGSLQKYFDDIIIESMDYETAKYLKGLLNLGVISLSTYTQSFYHGKFYKFIGDNYTCIIIGSSNVSKSGLSCNSELNNIFIFKNEDQNLLMYEKWLNVFKDSCSPISSIDLSRFNKKMEDRDTSSNKTIGKYISNETFLSKTRKINNINTQERMRIWLSHNPTRIYDQLSISPFKNYILFAYENINLYVFESFDFGNAFYCFKSNSLEELLLSIKDKTKLQLYKINEYYTRGYHISDTINMKINIASLF